MIIDFIYGNGGGSGSGSTGPQGPQGPQGYQGADGQNGADGINGQDGAQGPQGPQGEVGPQGAEGAQGPAGQNGTDGVQGPEGPQGATGAQGPQGPAGEGGSGSQDFIHLDNLNTAGESGKTYEYNGRLMVWVEESGYTAEWLTPIDQIRQSGNEGTGFIYATIPDGTTLFEFKGSSGEFRKVVFSGDTLYLMETAGTVVCAVTVGNTFKFEAQTSGNIRNFDGIFKNGYIGFKIGSYGSLQMQNVWDGKVNGGHYELIDKYNYPYLGASNVTVTGIPKWNGNGQIVRQESDVSTKNIFINTTGTGTTARTTYYTTGTKNGPDRWFAPETGGQAGQILQSSGENSAPTWINWIKAVKITSDAYEALDPKDPNTLYLIDDNV